MMASRSGRSKKQRQKRMLFSAGAAAGLIILMIIVIANAVSGSGNKDVPENDKNDIQTSSIEKTSRVEYEVKYVNYSDIHTGSLILVNDINSYQASADSEYFTAVDELKNDYYMIRDVTMKLDSLALKNFNSMISGFYQECSKNDIMITEAYVSVSHQNLLYNQALENSRYESRGGCSEHQTGLAVDLGIFPSDRQSYRYVPSGEYAWIKENCAKYGFIQRYPEGKSDITGITDHTEHFRYVGIPHAWYMQENDLSLEEYLQEVKKYEYTSRTLSVSCYDKEYEVYYIKAKDNNGSSDIYVPANCVYSISGNNIDGFIVTVEK